jgi:L-threonylcarbamoyladenylate synthase
MSDLVREFKQTLQPLLSLSLIIQLKRPHKIKVWYCVIFLIFLFIFAFVSGFLSSGYRITPEILSAPVFASIFGASIIAFGYNFTQGRLEMMKISEEKIETITKLNDFNEESISKIIRYFSLNSIIALHNFLIMKKLGNEGEALKNLIFQMNAEIFLLPYQNKLLKYKINDKPILHQIYWLSSAKKEEVLRYAIFNTKIFISQTDTIPGIFCKSNDISSAKKIFSIKKRSAKKPLAIYSHLPLEFFSANPILKMFLEDLKDIPLTLVAEPSPKAPTFCIKNGFVGVRILSSNSAMFKFLKENNLTLLGTSANISGENSPKSIKEISTEITNTVPIMNLEEKGGILQSSVIKIDKNKIIILREGSYIDKITNWISKNLGKQVKSFEDGEEKNSYIINLNKNEE